MEGLPTNESGVIYDLATRCRDLFSKYISKSPPSTSDILFQEYEERFLAWTAYMGVFADQSLSLDRRLRDRSDISDIVVRLLDVLLVGLKQIVFKYESTPDEGSMMDVDGENSSDEEISDSCSEPDREVLEIIETSLVKLSRLGTTIRESSDKSQAKRTERFQLDSNNSVFENYAKVIVDTLYPDSHENLRAQLTRSMVEIHASILYKRSHQKKLNTSRSVQAWNLPIIKESTSASGLYKELPGKSGNLPQIPPQVLPPSPTNIGLNSNRHLPPESAPSTLNSSFRKSVIQRELGILTKRETRGAASSIQLSKVRYPSPDPQRTDKRNLLACSWCSELHPPTFFNDNRAWSEHIDRDFEPYVCLSEKCMKEERLPRYPSFRKWLLHMNSIHSEGWPQKVHKPTKWTCSIEHTPEHFETAEKLSDHMMTSHISSFTESEIQAIVEYSYAEFPRPPEICPLCCRTLTENGSRDRIHFRPHKRLKLSKEGEKKTKNDSELAKSDMMSEGAQTTAGKEQVIESQGVTMARHIASHLQIIMLLMIRLMQCHTEESDDTLSEAHSCSNIDERSTINLENAPSSNLSTESLGLPTEQASILNLVNKTETNKNAMHYPPFCPLNPRIKVFDKELNEEYFFHDKHPRDGSSFDFQSSYLVYIGDNSSTIDDLISITSLGILMREYYCNFVHREYKDGIVPLTKLHYSHGPPKFQDLLSSLGSTKPDLPGLASDLPRNWTNEDSANLHVPDIQGRMGFTSESLFEDQPLHDPILETFKKFLPRNETPNIETNLESDADHNKTRAYQMQIVETLCFNEMDHRLHSISGGLEGTGDWIFQTTEFQQWLHPVTVQGFKPVLWIKSKPGAGKSTIMKKILGYLEESSSPESVIAAYFFYSHGSFLERSRIGLLRSLIYQLLEQDMDRNSKLRLGFLKLYESNNAQLGNTWAWEEDELENLLLQSIPFFNGPVFLLIDALDGCEKDDLPKVVLFLQKLIPVANRSNGLINICLSNRHYPSIKWNNTLDIILEKREEHTADIGKYVKRQLRPEFGPEKLSLRVPDEILDEIVQKAEGFFFWVILVVKSLDNNMDMSEISSRRSLQAMPTGIEELYEDILKTKSRDGERAIDRAQLALILRLMLLWKDLPGLKPQLLYHATTSGLNANVLRASEKHMPTDDEIERFILKASRGLIEVCNGDTGRVQFIHHTVGEFLSQNNFENLNKVALVSQAGLISHDRIASCCLAYIESEDLMTVYPNQDRTANVVELKKEYPFLEYAVLHLFGHMEDAQRAGQEQGALLQRLKNNHEVIERWRAIRDIFHGSGPKRDKYYRDMSLLYILCRENCPNLVRILLRDPEVNINAPGGAYGTALNAAIVGMSCRPDHGTEILNLLLNNGAKVDDDGGLYPTALQTAVSVGLETGFTETPDIITKLMAAGANINSKTSEDGGILQYVLLVADRSIGGSEIASDLIQMLLRCGADANAQGGQYGNALQAAAATLARQYRVCSIILDEFARDYNPRISGLDKIVKLLLEHGADVNAQGGYYGNALQAAVASAGCLPVDSEHDISEISETCEKIVDMLIDAGADVNAQGGYYNNPLQAAAVCNLLASRVPSKMISKLLEAGADVNTQSRLFKNAADAAFKTGCSCVQYHMGRRDGGALEILALLSAAGADGAEEARQDLEKYREWLCLRNDWRPKSVPSYDTYNKSQYENLDIIF